MAQVELKVLQEVFKYFFKISCVLMKTGRVEKEKERKVHLFIKKTSKTFKQ